MPRSDAEWWTTTDVAAYIGVTVGTISAYRGRGQMPAPDQTLGRQIHVWKPSRIIAWQQQRRSQHSHSGHSVSTLNWKADR